MGVSDRTSGMHKDTQSASFELDEDFTMIIGANHAAIIYEIGVVDGVPAPVVVHAMKARDKFLR
jgi:hypothetical protein